MSEVIEAVYEDGVLKPLAATHLQEQQRYRLLVQPHALPDWREQLEISPELAAEIERRTTILPDGRKLIQLEELFQADLSNVPDDVDPVREALDDLRKARAAFFEMEWNDFCQPTSEE